MKKVVTPSILREFLRYEPETGKLFWRERGIEHFRETEGRAASNICSVWNSRYAGREAFKANNSGYKHGRVFNIPIVAHRAIWAIMTGEWPAAEIDHINGIRNDNRWCNLRSATRCQNSYNKALSSRNSSGIKGVHWHTRDKRWNARIRADGKEIHLGSFMTPADAQSAYDKASAELHGEFRRNA